MNITLCAVTENARRLRSDPASTLAAEYLRRATQYLPSKLETVPTESALLATVTRFRGRVPPCLVLLDSAGKLFSSQAFATYLGRQRDEGRQHLIAAIGPADGWSAETRTRADLLLSLGPMTLPHALAQAVLAEQLYRALTILAGHPYHSGH